MAFTIEEMSIFFLYFPHIDFPIEKCVDCVSSGGKWTVILGIIFGIDTITPKTVPTSRKVPQTFVVSYIQKPLSGVIAIFPGGLGPFFEKG